MSKQNFIIDLAKLIDISPEQLDMTEKLKNYYNWDSLAAVSTIALLDQHFSKLVQWEDIDKCETGNDLLALVDQFLVQIA